MAGFHLRCPRQNLGPHQRSVPLFELRIQGTMSDFTNRNFTSSVTPPRSFFRLLILLK
jgi:hypothetical protein